MQISTTKHTVCKQLLLITFRSFNQDNLEQNFDQLHELFLG